MSESDNLIVPNTEELRSVQVWLNHLDDISESQPQAVIDETQVALPLLATWTGTDAYAWLLALRAKAFRLLDDLPAVLAAADAGLTFLRARQRADGPIAAVLHLEAGMSLNQFGRQWEAAGQLSAADQAFDAVGDDSGRAWSLVSLAEAYAGMGYPTEAEPLLERALECARASHDGRIERRAWKQMAVLRRHQGRPIDALEAIYRALEGPSSDHARANYLLELGHLLSWTGDFRAADDALEEAAASYSEYGDILGQANTERALAANALELGRNAVALRRLDAAAALYQRLSSDAGLAYVLRARSLLRLTNKDNEGAASDAEEGLRRFRRSGDTLGLAGMLRTAAQVRHILGDPDGAAIALQEALTLTADGVNPLAHASVQSLLAQIGDDAAQRLDAAQAGARLYARMGVPAGEAWCHAHAAAAYADLGENGTSLAALRRAADRLRAARVLIADPARRADHDFALRDVLTDLLNTAARLPGPEAEVAIADLIVDEAPLGLRNRLAGEGPRAVDTVLSRLTRSPVPLPEGVQDRSHLLHEIGAAIIALQHGEQPTWLTFAELADSHPEAAVVVYGSPTRDGLLPVAWRTPGGRTRALLVPLDEGAIDAIDALGYALSPQQAGVLWDPNERSWQAHLAGVFLPPALQKWLTAAWHDVQDPAQGRDGWNERGREMRVLFPSVLSHIPLEALLVDGTPLGVQAAVSRLVAPTVSTNRQPPPLTSPSGPEREAFVRSPTECIALPEGGPVGTRRRELAYLDPDLPWAPERDALRDLTTDPELLRRSLGANQLVLIGCHGQQAVRAEGALVASSGRRVLDAVDLLSQPLNGTTVVMEACYAGRYMGSRMGEQLTLATVALVAGASEVAAGLFALPADDLCTGRMVAHMLHELRNGVCLAEALRRARSEYWASPPREIRIPDGGGGQMPGNAPWAWAGLCAFVR